MCRRRLPASLPMTGITAKGRRVVVTHRISSWPASPPRQVFPHLRVCGTRYDPFVEDDHPPQRVRRGTEKEEASSTNPAPGVPRPSVPPVHGNLVGEAAVSQQRVSASSHISSSTHCTCLHEAEKDGLAELSVGPGVLYFCQRRATWVQAVRSWCVPARCHTRRVAEPRGRCGTRGSRPC